LRAELVLWICLPDDRMKSLFVNNVSAERL
jgi:hypothetical protein